MDKVHSWLGCRIQIVSLSESIPFGRFFDADGALLFTLIEHLTMQTLVTLVGIDMTFWMDGLNHAFISATLTWVAAIPVALEPIEHPQACWYG